MTQVFAKYQAAGNDFILIDDRSGSFPLQDVAYVEALCSRRFGVGADGLVLLQTSLKASFRMRIYNRDGREASFCGNGLRCLALYISHSGFLDESFTIETEAYIVPCTVRSGRVSFRLPVPKVLHWGCRPEGNFFDRELFVVDAGVPHTVVFVDDLESYPVVERGKAIRYHPFFAPLGTNVNFIQSMPDGSVRIRTYERGVEEETLSCGSGAAGVAFTVSRLENRTSPIRVVSVSGEVSEFYIGDKDRNAEMEVFGPAVKVFEGRLA